MPQLGMIAIIALTPLLSVALRTFNTAFPIRAH
jgi:hypothetical protein